MRVQKRKRRDRGWWNGERKSLDSDLWPHVFLFSFTLLFAPYVSFLILLTDSLCPALIWPQAVISVTFPMGQLAVMTTEGSVWGLGSFLGQHQVTFWSTSVVCSRPWSHEGGFIKEQVLCFRSWDYTSRLIFLIGMIGFEIILCFCWLEYSNLCCMKKLFLWKKITIVSIRSIQIACK